MLCSPKREVVLGPQQRGFNPGVFTVGTAPSTNEWADVCIFPYWKTWGIFPIEHGYVLVSFQRGGFQPTVKTIGWGLSPAHERWSLWRFSSGALHKEWTDCYFTGIVGGGYPNLYTPQKLNSSPLKVVNPKSGNSSSFAIIFQGLC